MMSDKGTAKKILWLILRIATSVFLLVFIFSKIDAQALLKSAQKADKGLLFLAFFVYFFSYLIGFWRWRMLLKVLGFSTCFGRIIIAYAGGIFFNLFLPSTIGGDIVRTMDLSVQTKRTKEVLATVLLDRLSGYAGLVLVLVTALMLGRKLVPFSLVVFPVVLASVLLIFILLILFNDFLFLRVNKVFSLSSLGKIGEALKALHQELYNFKQHKGIILSNVLLSLLIQIIAPLAPYIIAVAMGLKINILYFFIFSPIIGIITLLPISLGGLGVRDAASIFFFAQIGVPKDLTFAISLVGFSFSLIYGAIGGLIYVFTLHHRRLQPNSPS